MILKKGNEIGNRLTKTTKQKVEMRKRKIISLSTFLAVNDFFFALLLAGFMIGFTDGEDDYCIIQVWDTVWRMENPYSALQ